MTDSEDNDTNAPALWSGRHNYTLNSGTVLRDAYRLLCVVMADRAIAEFATKDNLVSLRSLFVEDELVHTVIQLAIMNRTQLDHMEELRCDDSELSFETIETKCGELTENDGANSDKKCLTFREACNKIIHAEEIKVLDRFEKGDSVFLGPEPTFILRGTKNRNTWRANLNILGFLRGTFDNFDSSA